MTDNRNEPDPTPRDQPAVEPADAVTDPTTDPSTEASAADAPVAAAAPRTRRLRDRMFGARAVAAVTLASLVLGGLGGAAVAAVVDDGPQHRGPAQIQMREGDGHPDHGARMSPGSVVPPATPPQDDVEPETPSDSGTSQDS